MNILFPLNAQVGVFTWTLYCFRCVCLLSSVLGVPFDLLQQRCIGSKWTSWMISYLHTATNFNCCRREFLVVGSTSKDGWHKVISTQLISWLLPSILIKLFSKALDEAQRVLEALVTIKELSIYTMQKILHFFLLSWCW